MALTPPAAPGSFEEDAHPTVPPAMIVERLNQLLFRIGARAYDDLTGQDFWRQQIRKLLDHVPFAELRFPATSTDGGRAVAAPRLADRGPLRVLDLGCGPGVSAFVLGEALHPASDVIGVDLSPEMLDRARRWHLNRFPHLVNVRFMRADATRLPFAAERFDLITGHSFLYLVPDRVGALREARRVLSPQGVLVFMEPSREGSLLWAGARGLPRSVGLLRHPAGSARFLTSMALWRVASAVAGRMSPDLVRRLFREAGWAEVACHPTLGGLGLHVVARGRVGSAPGGAT